MWASHPCSPPGPVTLHRQMTLVGFSVKGKKKNSLWKNSREGNLPTPLDPQAFLAAEGRIDQFTTSSSPGLVPGKDVGRVGINREGRAEW